ncbi:TetR/AcrR family transcriptional regulator [Shewanella sp. YIC-542]|uniref:TetR/AcrR family transcriptional regulator n=1 Tax=Shewanella mytili TaxID=3377111 RepID=UPI00398E56EB
MARSCGFEREQKLEQAMELFWQKGFANTSVADLVAHLGINRFSLYNSFGDKQKLYEEALAHYFTHVTQRHLQPLRQPGAGLAQLEQFLRHFEQRQQENPFGCFIQNAVVEHAGRDAKVQAQGERLFSELQAALTAAIANGQQAGEVTRAFSAAALADLLLVQIQGMRVLGKARRYEDIGRAVACLLQLLRVKGEPLACADASAP